MRRTCVYCGEKFETNEITECSTSEGKIRVLCKGKPWGFAAMDPEKRIECAVKGAERLKEIGLRHKWSHDEARIAGQRGGLSLKRRRSGCRPNDPFL